MEAREQIDRGLAEAQETSRKLMVVFGAAWCPDSLALDAALDHDLVRAVLEPSFVVLHLDVGNRDRHLELLDEWNIDVWRGVPTVAVLTADGSVAFATRDGELGRARSMTLLELASRIKRWSTATSS